MRGKISGIFEDSQRFLVEADGRRAPADAAGIARARKRQKTLRPVPLGRDPSFGFGDRIGLATPGHVEALNRAGGDIRPIFPQQSIREMTRTGRTPRQVMDDACFGMLAAGCDVPTGADADHLKGPDDVDSTVEAGFTFFTIDPSDSVDGKADDYPLEELHARYQRFAGDFDWVQRYGGESIKLDTGRTIELNDEMVMRAVVKYGQAVRHAVDLADYIRKQAGRGNYEIELSVDETPQPTTLAEHYIIADQLNRGGVKKLVSLAPRFVGDFEKGVDYKGDVSAFEASLADHAAIAEMMGPYKLSLHSGSDKLSIYPALGRITKGRFHVKTAGTSYLEALRVVARCEPKLFRRIVDFARQRYDTDRATYHVSADVESVPAPADVAGETKLEQLYLERWEDTPADRIMGFTAPGRQILHCTFGSVLTNKDLAPQVRQVLEANLDTYTEVLAVHFAKHLEALNAG